MRKLKLKNGVSSPLAPPKVKIGKKLLAEHFDTNKKMLDYALLKKQVTKEQYDMILSVLNAQREGANTRVINTKHVKLSDSEQIEWTIVVYEIDKMYIED